MELTREESRRYARHIVLKGIGGPGQQRLKSARVLVIGAGGLGSPAIAYLAAAGVGRIGIADDDTVSLSNLQRQIIHTTAGVGTPKTESAERFARSLNPTVEIDLHRLRLEAGNAEKMISSYDLIIDGTDLFSTRLTISDAALKAGKTLISGGVSMYDGHLTVIAPHTPDPQGRPNPRFRDLYPEIPDDGALPACEDVGVLGAVTGVIGTLMAMEAIKLITWIGEPLVGRLLLYDGRAAKFTEVNYSRRH
jgi:molybdopterin-synthase adenylyltransferase